MLLLEELKPGLSLVGLEPTVVANVVGVNTLAQDAVQVIYKTPDGTLKERLLHRGDEAGLSLATTERPWAFDGDGAAFQLACEAKRIDLAFLFDPMMAVHPSNVQPLPHQITAVYESMLPRQPLRYVLADDPGAGKTVMAGLYIRELILRADSRRILVVAPGSLVEQWKDELLDKFGLEFRVYSSLLEQESPSGNPFEDHNQLIVRLDQLSRNEPLQDRLCAAGWDLVVFDEAHKLAAHYVNSKLDKTARYEFAEKVGKQTRHLLLMTATPHNGKEEDFQLFLALLDGDRFFGKFREKAHKADASDLMRRMVKEELVKFDGTPLFPERRAYTVNYKLSPAESALYENVTKYVQTEMGKADLLHGARKGSVGFALTTLQRRLASSPEAAYQSLKRRRERLEERLQCAKQGKSDSLPDTLAPEPEDDEDLSAGEQESLEEALVDQATAAKTVAELETEILLLKLLEQEAHAVVASGQDRKWDELSKLLQHSPEMLDSGGKLRKLIIFSEHRDTLNYLHGKIAGVLGDAEAIITIHGGTDRETRRELQARFWSDAGVRVLVATDAAGEGVNLQCAHLMVNYDLPWNPNRLEQRFGRIHRINQTEVCHLWSLVAKETREGEVYHRLLEKIQVESEALKGRVFDVLGEVFEEESLKALLIRAIKYGAQPEVRAKLTKKVDSALDPKHIKALLERNALAHETMSAERLFAVREEMERAEARRLQPYFVRAFFLKAFDSLGGSIYYREADRYEITHVPQALRERAAPRRSRDRDPVLNKYERVCFTKEAIRPPDKPGQVPAKLIHPGHPLMLAVTDAVLEQHANLLRRGAVLVDPSDDGAAPWLLFLLTHEVKDASGAALSKRLQFIRVNPDGSSQFAGWAPHLDLEPLSDADRPLLKDALAAPWIHADQEQKAVAMAAGTLVPEHYKEVAERRVAFVEKTLAAVHERLTKEIDYLTEKWMRMKDEPQDEQDKLNIMNVRRDINNLTGRLELRRTELKAMRHVVNGTPVVLGGALIVPNGLLRQLRGEGSAISAADAAARKRIEELAMRAVMRAEAARGHRCVDVSKDKCGWDVTSYPPAAGGVVPEPRHIEVKGRVKGANTVTVTRNEILYAFNQGEKFVLAVVFVNPDDSTEGPFYLRNPFQKEPDWGAASVNYALPELLKRAEKTP